MTTGHDWTCYRLEHARLPHTVDHSNSSTRPTPGAKYPHENAMLRTLQCLSRRPAHCKAGRLPCGIFLTLFLAYTVDQRLVCGQDATWERIQESKQAIRCNLSNAYLGQAVRTR